MKALDVVDFRLPSFMCDLLKDPALSTFISKSHVCTMLLQFLNAFYSISWEFRNQSSSVYINVCMQKVPDSLFCIIFNKSFPSYFWLI